MGIVFLIVLLFILLFLLYASYSIRSGIYVKTLSQNKKKGKAIALTFDDGPDAIQTPKILDILKEYGVKATFFCIGEKIDGNESLLKRIDQEGHLTGNHSLTHSFLFPLQTVKRLEEEIKVCEEKIAHVIGKRPELFRPPFGVTNPNIAKAVKRTNYITIGWNIRSLDTNTSSLDKTVNRIRRKLKNGSVLLLHDRLETSDALLRMILEMLREENYQVVPLNQLFDINPYR